MLRGWQTGTPGVRGHACEDGVLRKPHSVSHLELRVTRPVLTCPGLGAFWGRCGPLLVSGASSWLGGSQTLVAAWLSTSP